MIQIREYLTTKINKSIIKATDETIKQIVKEEMDKYGHDCDLNHVDVSKVTNMNGVFRCSYGNLGNLYLDLNPDISEWNVKNVENMNSMFCGCKSFNQNLSRWDVSNVRNMEWMFIGCTNFNQIIDGWNVKNVKTMHMMFYNCQNFNKDLGNWDVSNVTDMSLMFFGCTKFNCNISNWNVSNVNFYNDMFNRCPIEEKYKPHFTK